MCWSHHKKNAQVELQWKYVGQTLLCCQHTENSISVSNSQSDLLPSGVEGSMCCRGMQQMHRFFGSPFSLRSLGADDTFPDRTGTARGASQAIFTGKVTSFACCGPPAIFPTLIPALSLPLVLSILPTLLPICLIFTVSAQLVPPIVFLHVPFIFFWSCQFSHFPHSLER